MALLRKITQCTHCLYNDYATSYQWQHNKTEARKTEVMQKKTVTCFFSLSFSSLNSIFFVVFLCFLLHLKGGRSCKMLESDKKKVERHAILFIVCRTTVVCDASEFPPDECSVFRLLKNNNSNIFCMERTF